MPGTCSARRFLRPEQQHLRLSITPVNTLLARDTASKPVAFGQVYHSSSSMLQTCEPGFVTQSPTSFGINPALHSVCDMPEVPVSNTVQLAISSRSPHQLRLRATAADNKNPALFVRGRASFHLQYFGSANHEFRMQGSGRLQALENIDHVPWRNAQGVQSCNNFRQ